MEMRVGEFEGFGTDVNEGHVLGGEGMLGRKAKWDKFGYEEVKGSGANSGEEGVIVRSMKGECSVQVRLE
jgi:hypothetical protein